MFFSIRIASALCLAGLLAGTANSQVVQLPSVHNFSYSGGAWVPDGGSASLAGNSYARSGSVSKGWGPYGTRASGPAPRAWYRPAIDWAGPDPLGRGLIIAPGGEVPSPWANQPRFRFGPGLAGSDTAINAAALDELIICWTQRRRFDLACSW